MVGLKRNIQESLRNIRIIFFPRTFSEKYIHVGYSYLGVPESWVNIVKKAVIDIEKTMYPKWMPMFLKRLLSYLTTGFSIVRIKNYWLYENIYSKIKKGNIHDIKDKYATLRIYGSFTDKQYKIIEKAEIDCENTCERCGSTKNVKAVDRHNWVYNLCEECQKK